MNRKERLIKIDGMKITADILTRMDLNNRGKILGQLKERDPEIFKKLLSLMIKFEDIEGMLDRDIRILISKVDEYKLTIALKGAKDTLKSRIFNNLSRGRREFIKRELESMPPVALSKVMQARNEIVQVMRKLNDDKKIMIHREEEDRYV
jgi:flagellar motor switch protein FliG